jgi:hypothetical protein
MGLPSSFIGCSFWSGGWGLGKHLHQEGRKGANGKTAGQQGWKRPRRLEAQNRRSEGVTRGGGVEQFHPFLRPKPHL